MLTYWKDVPLPNVKSSTFHENWGGGNLVVCSSAPAGKDLLIDRATLLLYENNGTFQIANNITTYNSNKLQTYLGVATSPLSGTLHPYPNLFDLIAGSSTSYIFRVHIIATSKDRSHSALVSVGGAAPTPAHAFSTEDGLVSWTLDPPYPLKVGEVLVVILKSALVNPSYRALSIHVTDFSDEEEELE